jgi:hypothetical protein
MGVTETSQIVKPIYTPVKNCRACGSSGLVEVLSLGEQYLCAFPTEINSMLPKAQLMLVRCASCGLLQLLHSTDVDLLYNEYWYRSSMNQTMRDALRDVVNTGLAYHNEGAWLDIGANDGCLLSHVPNEFTKIACEPAATFHAQLEEHADHVVGTFFSKAAVEDKFDGKCAVVTSCAMFYDLDDPLGFCKDIASVLHRDGVWINQLNDSPTMLETNGFDGICHEHVTYWDVHQLAEVYRKAGLKIVEVTFNGVNGGSMRVVAVKSTMAMPEKRLEGLPKANTQAVSEFALRIPRWRRIMQDLLSDNARRNGPAWGYGASTKFTAVLQYLDASQTFLSVADRNHAKHGRYMVGSWLPIVSEDTMRRARPRLLVVGPWSFRNEFNAREIDLRRNGTTMLYTMPSIEMVL